MPSTKRMEPMDYHIGQQIKIARIAAGMTQEQLGKAIGVTFQQVQKYENGLNRISGSRLQLIADALNVPRVVLSGRRPYPRDSAPCESQRSQWR